MMWSTRRMSSLVMTRPLNFGLAVEANWKMGTSIGRRRAQAILALEGLVPGLEVLSKGVEMAGDLLRRLKRGQVPDVRKHLQNGPGDPGQKLALKVLDGVDLVILARNHEGRRVDVTNRVGDVLEAGLATPRGSGGGRAPDGIGDQQFDILATDRLVGQHLLDGHGHELAYVGARHHQAQLLGNVERRGRSRRNQDETSQAFGTARRQ